MKVDDDIALEILGESLTKAGCFRRIALCRSGRSPLVVSVPASLPIPPSGTALWNGATSFFSGEEVVSLLPHGTCVVLAAVANGIVVVAEFVKVNQLGVAAVFAKMAAEEIRSRALRAESK